MSERRRSRAPSMMANKGLMVGSNSEKKKSLSRIASSCSQAEGLGKTRGRRKRNVPEEKDEDDFPRDKYGRPKDVIWSKSIGNLSAQNTIQTVREKLLRIQVPKHLKKVTMVVEKRNPNFKKMKKVVVAVPAPNDIKSSALLPSIHKGPRLDETGHVVPYSILGSVEDYLNEASRHGLCYQDTAQSQAATKKAQVTFSKPNRIKPRHRPNVDKPHALQYWREVIADRQRQKSNIIVCTGREPSELVMGEARTYSKYRVIRGEITAFGVLANPYTIPGRKDTRGTGFWTQPSPLGVEMSGIYESKTQTKRGHKKGIEYIGVPDVVQREKGHIPLKTFGQSEEPHFNLPKLHGICATGASLTQKHDSLPDGDNMAVIDNSTTSIQDEILQSPRTTEAPCTVPSCPRLLFGGNLVTWCNDVAEGVAVKAEVGMNATVGQRKDASLEIINTGPTTIFYDWKRIPQRESFELKRDPVHRFYFDCSSGILLPGETKHIRCIFKSPDAGVFSQMWKFEPRPLLNAGSDVILSMWGIAREVHVNREGKHIERDLRDRAVTSMCRSILDEVLLCLGHPEGSQLPRKKSYKWIFENAPRVDDHFSAINPGFYYHSDAFKGLLEITQISQTESESDASTSDLDSVQIVSLATLKKTLENLPEEDDNRNKLLGRFHRSVGKLFFTVQRPIAAEKLYIGRVLLSLAIDDMVTTSLRLRKIMGLSSETSIPEVTMSRIKNIPKDIKSRRKTLPRVPTKTPAAPSSKSTSRRKSHVVKTATVEIVEEKKELKTAGQCRPDPLKYRKYKEKLYCETYSFLGDMVEKLVSHLSGLAPPPTTIFQM